MFLDLDPRVVAALQLWAEVSERLRRYWTQIAQRLRRYEGIGVAIAFRAKMICFLSHDYV